MVLVVNVDSALLLSFVALEASGSLPNQLRVAVGDFPPMAWLHHHAAALLLYPSGSGSDGMWKAGSGACSSSSPPRRRAPSFSRPGRSDPARATSPRGDGGLFPLHHLQMWPERAHAAAGRWIWLRAVGSCGWRPDLVAARGPGTGERMRRRWPVDGPGGLVPENFFFFVFPV
jgi:hypothetical protein